MDKVKTWFKTGVRVHGTDDDENPTSRLSCNMHVETFDYDVEFIQDWAEMKSVQHGEDGGTFDILAITDMDDEIICGWRGLFK